MLYFEEAYFEGEERSGYFVESRIKHIWAAELELLKEIEDICRKHNLKYFAHAGTLLGAVRHQGFIPWDDDIDITMLRDDYEKFLRIAEKELKEYQLRCFYTEDDYNRLSAFILNGKKIRTDREHLERWHGCPYVVGIDIFPLDYISRNKEEEELRESLIEIVMTAMGLVRGNPQEAEELLQQVETYCGVVLDRTKPMEHQLVLLIDRLSQMFLPEEADEVARMLPYMQKAQKSYPKSCYEQQEWMPFETTRIAVPGDPHERLRSHYGDDYMTPKIWSSHDFFAEQEMLLNKELAKQDENTIF